MIMLLDGSMGCMGRPCVPALDTAMDVPRKYRVSSRRTADIAGADKHNVHANRFPSLIRRHGLGLRAGRVGHVRGLRFD